MLVKANPFPTRLESTSPTVPVTMPPGSLLGPERGAWMNYKKRARAARRYKGIYSSRDQRPRRSRPSCPAPALAGFLRVRAAGPDEQGAAYPGDRLSHSGENVWRALPGRTYEAHGPRFGCRAIKASAHFSNRAPDEIRHPAAAGMAGANARGHGNSGGDLPLPAWTYLKNTRAAVDAWVLLSFVRSTRRPCSAAVPSRRPALSHRSSAKRSRLRRGLHPGLLSEAHERLPQERRRSCSHRFCTCTM